MEKYAQSNKIDSAFNDDDIQNSEGEDEALDDFGLFEESETEDGQKNEMFEELKGMEGAGNERAKNIRLKKRKRFNAQNSSQRGRNFKRVKKR